jgi:hypothetical protein
MTGRPKLVRRLLASVVTLAWAMSTLGVTASPAIAGTTGDAGDYRDEHYDTGSADTAVVDWNGYTWDVIGYHSSGAAHGVIGPTDTVTLLLDKGSYTSGLDTVYNASSSEGDYSGSSLQQKMTSVHSALADKASVVTRSLAGGSALASDSSGYTGDTVAGATSPGQYLWPLSVNEASQLKASVRSFGETWWLRSPGQIGLSCDGSGICRPDRDEHTAATVDLGGEVVPDGHGVDTPHAARPALYLGIGSTVFSSIRSRIVAGELKIGAYDATARVADSHGHTWDVVGVNDGDTQDGVVGPAGTATLLLSNRSDEKFAMETPYTHDDLTFEGRAAVSPEYGKTDLKTMMGDALTEIGSSGEYGGFIVPRTLAGGSSSYGTTGYDEAKAAGGDVTNQSLWPMSVAEAKALTQQQRIFANTWWLRTPGEARTYTVSGKQYVFKNLAYVGGWNLYSNGQVYPPGNGPGNIGSAVRPALYLKLASPLLDSLPTGWEASVGKAVGAGWFTPTISLEAASIQLPATQTYTGEQLKPAVTVTLGGKVLRAGLDYSVSYGANRAVGEGTVKITAKDTTRYSGAKSATFRIVARVDAIRTPLATIYLTQKTSYQLLATAQLENEPSTATLGYESSSPKVLTVTSKGKLAAKKVKKATKVTVTITADTVANRITVWVVPKKASPKVSATVPTSLNPGQVAWVIGTAKKGTNPKVTFASSNKSVATVDKYGKLIAKAKGKTTITVKIAGKKVAKKLTVT